MRLRRLAVLTAAAAALAGSITPSQAIVGGAAAPEGAYPFMAAITDSTGFQFCGGSVIASTWILTAAHCVVDETAGNIRVVTGRTNLDDTSKGQVLRVSAIRVHPQYDGNGHDAALLQLSSATTAPPIAVATSANDNLEAAGTVLRVTGWGDQTNTLGFTATPDLRFVDVKVVSDSSCATTNFGLDAPTAVCAGDLLKDSCQGDSGGPLFLNAATRIQVGVVSYGTGCAVPEFPGVYSELNNASIRSFITQYAGV